MGKDYFDPTEYGPEELRAYQFIGDFAALLHRYGMTCTGLDLARILCWNEFIDGDHDDPKIARAGAVKTKVAYRMAFHTGDPLKAHACYERYVSKASGRPMYDEAQMIMEEAEED